MNKMPICIKTLFLFAFVMTSCQSSQRSIDVQSIPGIVGNSDSSFSLYTVSEWSETLVDVLNSLQPGETYTISLVASPPPAVIAKKQKLEASLEDSEKSFIEKLCAIESISHIERKEKGVTLEITGSIQKGEMSITSSHGAIAILPRHKRGSFRIIVHSNPKYPLILVEDEHHYRSILPDVNRKDGTMVLLFNISKNSSYVGHVTTISETERNLPK